jgi:phospholipid transport system substrate-binding protein
VLAQHSIEASAMRKLLMYILALTLNLAAPYSLAQDIAPDKLLHGITMEVIGIIGHDQEIQAGDQAKVAALVESKILPHFDFARMTQIAVARNWWLTTAEQKKNLIAEFRTLLVRTYSATLSNYSGQAVEFKRLRTAPGDTEVTVKSVVRHPRTESLNMDYEMEKLTTGWKVFDIKIDGISLITSYRETFASKIRELGVDGLISALAEKNRQNVVRFQVRSMENLLAPAIVQSLLLGGR